MNDLTFEENLLVIIGIGKGTYQGMESLPTKEELVEELEEEMSVMTEEEVSDYKQIIIKIEKMSDEEFLDFYETVPSLKMENDQIIQVTK